MVKTGALPPEHRVCASSLESPLGVTKIFVFLRLAAFTQHYVLPARPFTHALRVMCRPFWLTTVHYSSTSEIEHLWLGRRELLFVATRLSWACHGHLSLLRADYCTIRAHSGRFSTPTHLRLNICGLGGAKLRSHLDAVHTAMHGLLGSLTHGGICCAYIH